MSDEPTVTARFYVQEVTHSAYNPQHARVTLNAVTRGEENKSWSQATPSGQLTMSISNPKAAEFFTARLGEDVEITFRSFGPAKYPTPYQEAPSPAA